MRTRSAVWCVGASAGWAAAQLEGPVQQTPRVVPDATGVSVTTVVTGLDHPWAAAWLPDGAILITERSGRFRLVRDGVLEERPVRARLPRFVEVGQGGLMDVALHPGFAQNGLVYFTYAVGEARSNHTALARGRFAEGAIEDIEIIFECGQDKSGGQHFGSRVLWLPDGTLLLSIGDGGNPPVRYNGDWIRKQAQRLDTHFGKVLRLTDEGKPAAGNPMEGRAGALAEIWTFGHRNIQGLARDPQTGTIWANEHGARGGDELNVLRAGENYGWPDATYSVWYVDGSRISEATSLPGMTDPEVVWTPSKAPSGLAFYTGDAFPAWRGDLFSGALAFREVRRIDLESGEVRGQERIRIDGRVRDVRQGPDGLLYVLTDEADGALLRLSPALD